LEAELPAGLEGDVDRAIGLLLHLLGEGHRVLGMEVADGPDRGHVPVGRGGAGSGRDLCCGEQGGRTCRERPSRDHGCLRFVAELRKMEEAWRAVWSRPSFETPACGGLLRMRTRCAARC